MKYLTFVKYEILSRKRLNAKYPGLCPDVIKTYFLILKVKKKTPAGAGGKGQAFSRIFLFRSLTPLRIRVYSAIQMAA